MQVNFHDSKSAYQAFIMQHNITCVAVAKENGGALFNTALNNDNTGGYIYLIKPDKSYKRWDDGIVRESHLKDADIQPTALDYKVAATDGKAIQYRLVKNDLILSLPRSGAYSVSLYRPDGRKRVLSISKDYRAGEHRISPGISGMASGVYFIEIKGPGATERAVFLLR